LIVSQILTLYTTPVVYLLFDWIARKLGGSPISTIEREPMIETL
jgi:hypothetical protein